MSLTTDFWNTLPPIIDTNLLSPLARKEKISTLSDLIELASATPSPIVPNTAVEIHKLITIKNIELVKPYSRKSWPTELKNLVLDMHAHNAATRKIAIAVGKVLEPLNPNISKISRIISKWRFNLRVYEKSKPIVFIQKHLTRDLMKLAKRKGRTDTIASLAENSLDLPRGASSREIRYLMRDNLRGLPLAKLKKFNRILK